MLGDCLNLTRSESRTLDAIEKEIDSLPWFSLGLPQWVILKSIIVLKSCVNLIGVLNFTACFVSLSWGKKVASGSSCSITVKMAPMSMP